jgi:hypothetical protein
LTHPRGNHHLDGNDGRLEGNLLKPTPESCRMIKLEHPILTNEELEKLRHVDRPGFKAVTLPILFKAADGAKGLEARWKNCSPRPTRPLPDGSNILILSDRGISAENAPIPALLAVAGLHHHLIRRARARASGWCSNRANRARCIILRCSSATVAAPSIPISRSRRSTT